MRNTVANVVIKEAPSCRGVRRTSRTSLLASTLAKYAGLIRQAIDDSTYRRDPVSADIFTEIGSAADKWRWLVAALAKCR